MRLHAVACALAAFVVTGCSQTDTQPLIVGQLQSDRIEVMTDFSERVVEQFVREGDTVAAGDVLLRLDDRRAVLRVRELRAVLQEQQARLAELTRGPREEQIRAERANLAGARDDVAFRKLELERAQNVLEKGLSAAEEVDRARIALDSASSKRAFHQARLAELLAGTTTEELERAESMVAQAEARLASAELDLELHRIVAPVAGRIDSLIVELGEHTQQDQPALVLLAGTQPFARAYIPQALRSSVAVGDAVRVHADGLNEPLAARIRWLASDAAFTPYFALTEHDRGRLSYLAKIDIDGDMPRLADGMPVEVEVVEATVAR